MNLLRPGDWRPAGAGPALLVIQLVATLQAALRGLDYWRGSGVSSPVLAAVEDAAPPMVWAALLCIPAAVVLVGMAGRWPAVIILGHLIIGAVYLGLGFPVLAAAATGPAWVASLALLLGAGGTWVLAYKRGVRLPGRIIGAASMVVAALALSGTLGVDYRTGTGLLGAGVMHGALAYGVGVCAVRRRLTAEMEEEEVRA